MRKSLFKTGGSTISSFSTVVGITLVLTMVGALFIFLLVAKAVTSHFNEQLTVQVFIKEGTPEDEILLFKKQLEIADFTGEIQYVSADQAAQMMQEEIGEEFVDFLGYNPLLPSLDVKIDPSYSSIDSLQFKFDEIAQLPMIDSIEYQKDLLQNINENIGKWGLGLLVLGILFLIIAVVLIVNTIELAIFSQRFIIKSMQLVGATHWFIQKPFMKKALRYGLVSALLALVVISAILFYFKAELVDVISILTDNYRFVWLIAGIFIAGALVSLLATAYAVRRFVKIAQTDLY